MLHSPRLLVSVVSLSIALGCSQESAVPKAGPAPAKGSTPTPVKTEGPAANAGKSAAEIATTVRAAMDPSADPCTDFYQYACGGWIRDTKLPSDQSRWVRSFSVLRERNREILRDILEDAAANAKGDDERGKLGRFYRACMDEAAIEGAGAAPLSPLFAEIAEVKDVGSFMTMAGKLQAQGLGVLFGLYVGPDDKNPKMNIAHVTQGGLGMPDRDYYLEDKNKEIRAAYQEHVARMFGLLGEPEKEAAAIAREVLEFETTLARAHMTRVERRDPDRTYHKIDRAGIEQQIPGIEWGRFAAATGHPEIEHINVKQLDYLKAAAAQIGKAAPKTLQNYLRWRVLDAAAELLSAKFVDEHFAFYGKTLRGQKELEARWKRCTTATDDALTHPLGKLYVERAFAGNSKNVALDLIRRIERAFEDNLPGLAWMDETTRSRAIAKVKAIYNKIGYPDKWRDYGGLAIGDGGYFANAALARRFEHDYQAAKVGQPVEREEWRGGPPVVNASYSGTRNEMWFPAGILQAPFFDESHPMVMNFGGIGVVMGHELTHGFDDQGRKFDADGVLRQWWEDPVIAQFEQRTACVDRAYSAKEVEPGLAVNGKLTLGENTADMGGVKQAYQAYKQWAAENGGDAAPHVEGLTNEQLLFVSFAQIWCTVATPEYLRVQVATDPHSPGQFRATVPLVMSRDFAAAFQCAPGTPMNPAERCEVW